MSQDHDNYWQAVQYLAENIVAELADEDPEEDRDELPPTGFQPARLPRRALPSPSAAKH